MKSEVQQKNEDYVKIKLDKCRKQIYLTNNITKQ